jgi:predicted porin
LNQFGVIFMKKTLIALAVMAASGASFAQVTITGNLTMGYKQTSAPAGDASGFGVQTETNTSGITFTANEDLGGGLKAKAVMSMDGVSRAGVFGGDASLALTGGFGGLTLATGRGTDYLSEGIAGVGGVKMDDKVFTQLFAKDTISYALPKFIEGLSLSVTHEEAALSRAGETASPIGLGVGAAGLPVNNFYQRGNSVSATYVAGPLAANLGYIAYDQDGNVNGNAKNRISIAASYDLGMLKLGAGYRNTQRVDGTRQDALVSANVPLGALSLGANFAQRITTDTTQTAAGTRTGYGLKAQYDLSKRTNMSLSYAKWDATVGAVTATTDTLMLLSHSF